jgi:coenzyme F420-0:L-glutamate ligase
LRNQRLELRHGDVLAIASKIVSTCENRVVKLSKVRITIRAQRLARRWAINDHLAALVSREADQILGGMSGFLLTVKNGTLTPNAGIDVKNSPRGTATLWPIDPDRSARRLRRSLERQYKTAIGVEIVDSHVTARRLGTGGLAIGLSGFVPILDHRGVRDIFGRPVKVTQSNIADDIASAAHLVMGESAERVGAVVIRNAPIKVSPLGNGRLISLNPRKCLISSGLSERNQTVSSATN